MNAIADLLTDAGLTGRGGAGFPTGVKVDLAHRHGADLIINACDGEIDATKDGWVIAHRLDAVLTGARLLTAGRIRVAAHRGSAALAILDEHGCDTVAVPHRYVASEESSLVSLAHGGQARPLMRWSPVTAGARGHDGRRLRPTLVLNAETVWRAAQIADRGVRWFRSFGTRAEPGPRLVTVANGVGRPGVVEAEAGPRVGDLLGLAGGQTVAAQAFWLGGLGGGFLPAADASRTAWSRAGLAPHHVRMGAATVRLIEADADPWAQVAAALDYAAAETAGQCGPCMFGLPAIASTVADLRNADDPGAASHLTRRVAMVRGRGACRFPDGVADFVASALEVFGAPRRPESAPSELTQSELTQRELTLTGAHPCPG
ncbi:NADH-ubiquinone oxidoreductase-F iron-sulfur binding region domain-containing protein [Gordonia sp. NPDC003504]